MNPQLSRRRVLQAAAAATAVLPLVAPGSAYAGSDIQRLAHRQHLGQKAQNPGGGFLPAGQSFAIYCDNWTIE